jgi:hypothetical protein
MPQTVIEHEDGSRTVVDTNDHGDTRVHEVGRDGGVIERASIGSGQSHIEVVTRYRRIGDLRVEHPR